MAPEGHESGENTYDDLAVLARQVESSDRELADPPDEVWDAITASLSRPEVDGVDDRRSATPVDLASWRRASRTVVAGLSAAAIVLLVVLGGWLLSSDPDAPVGRADLGDLARGGEIVGEARVLEVDGGLQLEIDSETVDPGAGSFLEVWVIDPEISELVSLGPVRADGTYDLPPGLDPTSFPIVDISREPLNGDPTHSGDSVVQGQLEFA